MSNTLVALTLIDSLLTRATAINATLQKARAEGRDVTDAELAAAASADDIARAQLAADIARAKAEGR